MEKTDPIVFIPPVHWNYYPYRDQELPSSLAERGYSCIYLNPVAYRGSERSMRFKEVHRRQDHPRIGVIDRRSRLGKSFLELLWENLLNIRAVKRFKPRAVISSDHLMSTGACIYCRLKKIPFVFDVTDNWELVDSSMAGRFYKSLLKPLLARFAHAVTCTSQRQFDYFKKRRRGQTVLISNGINPLLLDQLESNTGLPGARPEVNFIGSLRDWYDFELLFDVFRELPDMNLHIYGTGPLLEELLERSRTLPNIQVHGNVEPARTASLLKRSLCGILPLKINELNQSTCPIKLFDYWGASRAVISSPVEEVVRVGGDALLYASTKEEYLAAIKKLAADEALAEKLGRAGKRKVDKTHNYTSISDQFIQILNSRNRE